MGVGPVPDRNVSSSPNLALRLGLRYVKGLSEQSGRAIVRERAVAPFAGINDLRRRVSRGALGRGLKGSEWKLRPKGVARDWR